MATAGNGGDDSGLIGAAVRRKEDFRLIQGAGRYAGDGRLRDMAVMAVLRSPYARARIRGVDTTAAGGAPGVFAALSGAELNAMCQSQLPLAGVREYMNAVSRWPMAGDAVRYEGEPVAVVVAADGYAARDALELVAVDYEPLPAVIDLERALDADAPLVHEDLGD